MENFREHFAGFAEIDEELLAKLDNNVLFAKSNTTKPDVDLSDLSDATIIEPPLDEIKNLFFTDKEPSMKQESNPLLMAYKSCFKIDPDLLTDYLIEHFDTNMLKKLCSIKPAGLSEVLSEDDLAKLKTFIINNPEYKDLLNDNSDKRETICDSVLEDITNKFIAVPEYFDISFDIDETSDTINSILKREGIGRIKEMCVILRHKSKLMENTAYLMSVIGYIERSDTKGLLEIITSEELIDLSVKLLTDGYLDMYKVRNSIKREISDIDMLVLEKFFTDMHSELKSYSNMFSMCTRICKEFMFGGVE